MAQLHKKFMDSQVKELLKRYINKEIERKYVQEILGIKKRRFFALVIEDKNVPLWRYNYTYIKDRLGKQYNQQVSLPTIIDRARKNGFYLKKVVLDNLPPEADFQPSRGGLSALDDFRIEGRFANRPYNASLAYLKTD